MHDKQQDLPSDGLPDRLRQARARTKLSQSELSLKAGLNRKACFDIETCPGQCNAGVSTVAKLARILGVSAAWLAFGDGPRERLAVSAPLGPSISPPAPRTPTARLAQEPEDLESEDLESEEQESEDLDTEEQESEDLDTEEPQSEGQDPIWPYSHRQLGLDYHELPPLGREYAPVLNALGSRLPEPRRKVVGHWLLQVVAEYDPELTPRNMRQLRELLVQLVPDKDRKLVDQVMQDLLSRDPVRRGMRALVLIIDAGLPVAVQKLEVAMYMDQPKGLVAALEAAVEILTSHLPVPSTPFLSYPWKGRPAGGTPGHR